jgi:hypothetical protein
MHTARARILAVLAILLLATPAGALSRDQYFCRMMGRLMGACCCKQAPEKAKSSTPEIKARNCCELVPSAARGAAPALRESTLHVESPLVAIAPAVVSAVTEPALSTLRVRPARARAPPRPCQRIFLRNCSLLT